MGLVFALLLTYTKQQIGANADVYLLRMTPFVLTLVVMVVAGRFIKAPAYSGKHFDKGLR